MNLAFSLTSFQGDRVSFSVAELPDICPICHVSSLPLYIAGSLFHSPTIVEEITIQTVFRCPRIECQKLFIADYVESAQIDTLGGEMTGFTFQSLKLVSVAPSQYQPKNFPDSIRRISPMFCNVFDQSAQSESLKLLDIAGTGYRKALEFLIKDYLVTEEPDKEEAIKQMALMNAITNKIQDANLKICATRAAWLGNDETHYLRVWDSHDISDLKRLITLSVNWIENSILTKEYAKTMPSKKV
jgi:hypothetical protein